MKVKLKVISIQLCLLLFLLVIWEIAGRISPRMFFVLGTPTAVALELWKLLYREGFHVHVFVTAAEALSGLFLGTAIGSMFGLYLWYSDTAARVTRPFIVGLGTLPIFAFAPLMIIWFGIGFQMKAAMATFATIFFAFAQSYRAARSVASEYVEFLKGMGASRWQVMWKAIVPGSITSVLGSMRMNVGLALLGAFIGEFIASNQGLGFLILRAASLYNVPRAFAAAIGIMSLALMLDLIGALIEQRSYFLVQLLSVNKQLWRKPR